RLLLHDNRYPSAREIVQFEAQMLDRLRALPGVASATVASTIPMVDASRLTFSIEGSALAKIPVGTYTLVYPHYFETLQIPLRAGQAFTGRETAQSPPVAVVNETLARRFFAGVSPIGRRIKWGSPASPSPWATIVGVAADVKAGALDAP